jgi:fumarate hydratase subunit beta
MRILEYLRQGKRIPFDLKGGVLYHCGPLTRKRNDKWEVVSAGPTTSARMNDQTPELVRRLGVKAIVGKGGMSGKVSDALKKHGCVYLAFTGGAGALAASKIRKVVDVFWPDLSLPEAVWVLEVSRFGPLVVAMDAGGNSIYSPPHNL